MGKTAEDLRYELEQQRESLGHDLVAIGDRVSPGRMVERRKFAVRQSFGKARDAVMGAKDSAVGRTSDGFASRRAIGLRHVVGRVGRVERRLTPSPVPPRPSPTQTQGNPLAAGLIAFGVGALAGSLLPTSRREEQAVAQVQPALESAAQELGAGRPGRGRFGQGARHRGRPAPEGAAQDAAESVKAEAQDAAESVKTEAQDAAAETKDAAAGTEDTKRA